MVDHHFLGHAHENAFSSLNPLVREGLTLLTRRNMLKASVAGLAGLNVPELLRQRAAANAAGRTSKDRKSVILLWMSGGPSHIDTFDPKPDRPSENRGPFAAIRTKLPGVFICEHLPKMAAMMDRFTLIRSVDCRFSNHEPNMVMQTANGEAEPRISPNGHLYPAIGSVVAKMHGANHPGLPPYVAFIRSRSHLAFAGYLGKQYDPFLGHHAAILPVYTEVGADTGRTMGGNLFQPPHGSSLKRIAQRQSLAKQFDGLRKELDVSGSMEAMDHYARQAVEMVTGSHAQQAFDLRREPSKVRERFGKHLWCQEALLARRLVEAGVSFVTIDLSYHPASGTWDTHGDNIPPYGGIKKGLGPLLPIFDHLLTTLIQDLEQRQLLDNVLVLAMGEFGRTPRMGTQGSTDGRDHWPVVMSMAIAGGGYHHGQVIGATEKDGGQIKERPVTPGDIAATIYDHMGVSLTTTYVDSTGRPRPILEEGQPIQEMS